MRFAIGTLLSISVFFSSGIAQAGVFQNACDFILRTVSKSLPQEMVLFFPTPVKAYGKFELKNGLYGWMSDPRFSILYSDLAVAANKGLLPKTETFFLTIKKTSVLRNLVIFVGDKEFSNKKGDSIEVVIGGDEVGGFMNEVIYKISTATGDKFTISVHAFEGNKREVIIDYNPGNNIRNNTTFGSGSFPNQ